MLGAKTVDIDTGNREQQLDHFQMCAGCGGSECRPTTLMLMIEPGGGHAVQEVNCLCSKHCEDNEVESTTYLLLSEG